MVRAMMGKKKAEYIQDGLLLWLDGRDAPVNNAWVDRVNKTACGITGPIEYLQDQKCYSTTGNNDTDANSQYITLPNTLLQGSTVFTIQVVGKNYPNNRNGCYISIRSIQNGVGQFTIWPIVGRIYYYLSRPTYYYTSFPIEKNVIMSITGSRNGNNCRSYVNGVFANLSSGQNGGSGSCYLFKDSEGAVGWNMRGAIYCVRIYSRQLSDEEMIYNYEIDKKLFGAI